MRIFQRVRDFRQGLRRSKGEHFSVVLASAATKSVSVLKSPANSYYADPFVYWHQERAYVFCEEFSYLTNKGHLTCITLDPDLHPARAETVMAGKHHLSFPFLLEADGALYMVPETHKEGGIHLYRCERFPDKWVRLRTLVPHVDAVDSVVLAHKDRWWIITSLIAPHDPNNRYLAVYSADELSSESWTPHPINEQRRYIERPFSSGRNAGPAVRAGGKLLRPAQENLNQYGDTIQWMEILTLTDTEFQERPLPEDHALAKLARLLPVHHMASHGDLAAWDIRDRGWSDVLTERGEAAVAMSASIGVQVAESLIEAVRRGG